MRHLAIALLVATGCGHAAAPSPTSAQPTKSTVIASHADPVPLLDPAADADGDEIANGVDACPNQPEDFDLHDDTDGCPDLDDDRDGVPDLEDHCFDTPGVKDERGCPADQDCVFVSSIDDCWLSPIAFDTSPPSAFDHIVTTLKQYPEIREVTLQTQQSTKQPAGTARARLERVKKELVARGIPPSLVALKELDPDADPHNPLRSDVFGLVTKQRFKEGKFRETLCAEEMGPVYRVARDKNYGCKPPVCGDKRCGANETVASCPQDCP